MSSPEGRQPQAIGAHPFVKMKQAIPLLILLITGLTGIDAKGEASLTIRIVDAAGNAVAARAWIELDEAGQRFFTPEQPESVTVYAKDRSFSCDGEFTITLPPGKVTVHVEKGKEYTPVDLAVEIPPSGVVERVVTVSRWIDMPAEGWFSADLHVHLGNDSLSVLKQLALSDDVHFVPAFTYWLRGKKNELWSHRWPLGITADPIVVDEHHVITRNNIEIERINRDATPGGIPGATFLFNLRQPVTADRFGEYFPTDASLCREAKTHSPDVVFDSDKPSWAETVIGAALGTLDTIQLCHNHFHRDATISGGWGMIGPLAPGESNDAAGNGLFHRTNDLYYRFLNCGFPLGVSGGSAVGVMPVPTGFHRVYAKIDGPLTAEKMWQSIKAGRSFATTGPILTMTADGREIGDTIKRQSVDDQPVRLVTRVRSIEQLEALQIVHNGRILASRDLNDINPDQVLDETLQQELNPKRSGWIAARCLFRGPDGLLRQAHTSPIYFLVDEKAIAFQKDAEYMIQWIDVLEKIARDKTEIDRFPDSAAREGVLADYTEARGKYEQISRDAQHHWGSE